MDPQWIKIESPTDIFSTDDVVHLAVRRFWGLYFHHYILIKDGAITKYHYTSNFIVWDWLFGGQIQKEQIEESDLESDIKNGLFKINHRNCPTKEEAISRCDIEKKEKKYSAKNNNCEHFAFGVMTGTTRCTQLETSSHKNGVAKMVDAFINEKLATFAKPFLRYSHRLPDFPSCTKEEVKCFIMLAEILTKARRFFQMRTFVETLCTLFREIHVIGDGYNTKFLVTNLDALRKSNTRSKLSIIISPTSSFYSRGVSLSIRWNINHIIKNKVFIKVVEILNRKSVHVGLVLLPVLLEVITVLTDTDVYENKLWKVAAILINVMGSMAGSKIGLFFLGPILSPPVGSYIGACFGRLITSYFTGFCTKLFKL